MSPKNIIKDNWWKYLAFILLFVFFCIYFDIFKLARYEFGEKIIYTLNLITLLLVVVFFIAGLLVIYLYDLSRPKLKLKNSSISKLMTYIKRYGWILLIIIPFLVALFQVYSIWDFDGEKIDESTIFLYSIGFFGGDFNPHWFGYGSLGMYLVYLAYIILYVPMYIMGKFSSLEEYAMQIFYNGYFIAVARYVFAVFSVFSIILYSKVARLAKISIPLIIIYFLFTVTSCDAIYFANYLRCDYLVSFFVALLIYAAYRSNEPKYLYIMALACAGAFATKKSALPLIFLLAGYVIYRLIDKTIKWKHVLYIGLIFLVLIFVFQPFANYFDIISKLFSLGTDWGETATFNLMRVQHYSVTDRLLAIWNHVLKFVSSLALYCLVLLVFSKRYIKLLIPAVSALLLLVLPFLTSNEIPPYWFAPVFVLIYFLALIGVAGFIDFLGQLLVNRLQLNEKFFQAMAWGLLAILAVGYIVQKHIPSYLSKYGTEISNAEVATKWIEQNLLENEHIILDSNNSFYNPRVYDRDDFKTSGYTSRVFLYNRKENKFLCDILYNYLQDYYYQNIGIDSVKGIRRLSYIDVNDSTALSSIKGKYFVTSKYSYNRYFKRKDSDLNDRRKSKLANMKEYYNFMLSQPLVKRFSEGRGVVVEIYHVIGETQ